MAVKPGVLTLSHYSITVNHRSAYVPENIQGPKQHILAMSPKSIWPDSRTADRTLNAVYAQVRKRPHSIVGL